jgi:hypothetical protein
LATGLQIWNPAMAQIFVVAVSVACVMMCGQANANAQQSSANIFPKLTSGVENQADSTQADDSMRKPQLVDMSLFLKRHRGFTLFGQPLSNVKIDGTPAVSPAGQIPYYGGPLQNYSTPRGYTRYTTSYVPSARAAAFRLPTDGWNYSAPWAACLCPFDRRTRCQTRG